MDMERQEFSTSSPKLPVALPLGHLSTELTGFSGPSHYHIQMMLGEDPRRLSPTAQEEWPTTQGY